MKDIIVTTPTPAEWEQILAEDLKPWLIAEPTYTDRDQDFARLVRSFHVFDDVPDNLVLPYFDPSSFDAWVVGMAYGEYAVLQAGAFILGCFSQRYEWKCGKFDAISAMVAWDTPNRRAFAAWCKRPWRP